MIRYVSSFAALFLLTLGAVTARADQGIAYALISNGTTAAVNAEYSLNPGGGAVTAARTGTGAYTVTFPNSGIGVGWVAQTAATGNNSNYCNIVSWGSSLVLVECRNASGILADSTFSVSAFSNINDKNIAFALGDQPSTSNYTPDANYSYNPGGSISITRSGAGGAYTVFFSGLSGGGGFVQATAFGSTNVSCYTFLPGGPSPLAANVICVDPAGARRDTEFVVTLVPAGSTPTGIAFTQTLASNSTADIYNPTGQPIGTTHTATGQYVVTFAGLNAAQVNGGNVRVTALNAAMRCKATSWGSGPGSSLQALVSCFDLTGAPADNAFDIVALPPMGYAYALISDGTAATVPAVYAVNPGGGTVTASRGGVGSYSVTFPNSGIGVGWSVQANAYGAGGNYCKVGGWGSSSATVRCFSPVGVAADSAFTVLAISSTNDKSIAFALADQASAASYAANPSYSYSPTGPINIARNSAGQYTVTFAGLAPNGGTVQVTAYGAGNTTCSPGPFAGTDYATFVTCQDPNGVSVDSQFVIAAIPAGVTPAGIAWVWANNPTAALYGPNASFSYNPGGAIALARSGPGQYSVTFSGVNAAQVQGGDARATAFNSAALCKVVSWTTSSPDVQVNVNCFDGTGTAFDTRYLLLFTAPVPGAPATVTANSGTPQSTAVNAVFATALSVRVADANNIPIANVSVTFTAPGSNASGRFPGNALTATVVTSAAGIATAPAFTASGTAGGYSVTASALGTNTATFALTNTPVTSVSLTTSPANLLVSLDGGAFVAAPLNASLAPGSVHTIATQSPQGNAGTQYVWLNWSDSGAVSHGITVPSSAVTYTANFNTQYQLTISALPAAGGVVTPVSETFYDAGTVVPVNATANAGYSFGSWTGGVASASSASTSVTMSAARTVTANFLSFTGTTIQTSPAGLQFTVDGGAALTAPQTLSLSQGSHTIAVVGTQAGGAGTQYVFTGWSDSGAASHAITVGAVAATYTATFKTQYQLTMAASPVAGGTVTPVSGTFYDAGTAVPVVATAATGYQFSGWTGGVASSSSASTTITMNAPATVTGVFTVVQVTSGLRFVPVTPCRIMDTRGANGTFSGPIIAAGGTRTVPVPSSACGIPATAQAYSLNITVVPPGPLTYLTIWPAGQAQPNVSTLNSFDGRIVANAAIVPAGSSGAVNVFTNDASHVIIDINGYFAPASTAGSMAFYAATPCRVADTRFGSGQFGAPFMAGGSTRNFTIPASACGIPATAQAYSVNMTVVPRGPLGYLTTWPAGQAQPVVSTLNSYDGSVVANAAIVPAGAGGAISVFVTDNTDLIIDVNGYFAPAGSAGALSLYTLTPCRVVDTRFGGAPFGGPILPAGGTRSFPVPTSGCSVPAAAQAYSMNVTVVPPGPLTYLTAWPTGQVQPVVSTLNSLAGKVVANAAIVPAGTAGGASIYVSDASHVILDINAYFAQ